MNTLINNNLRYLSENTGEFIAVGKRAKSLGQRGRPEVEWCVA